MPRKGEGRLSADLRDFSARQLGEFREWLKKRHKQLQTGYRRMSEAFSMFGKDYHQKHAQYYKNAAKGAKWIVQQLDYVIDARAHQEGEAPDAAGSDAKKRK